MTPTACDGAGAANAINPFGARGLAATSATGPARPRQLANLLRRGSILELNLQHNVFWGV